MRRRLHRWAAWLLPFLFARLFVPVGFMLSPSSEGLGIALCPGYAELPMPVAPPTTDDPHAGMDHGAHAIQGGAHGSHGAQDSGHHTQGQSACPFALVGGMAGCPVAPFAGELPRLVEAIPAFHPHPAWISPAVLINRIRGPPLA